LNKSLIIPFVKAHGNGNDTIIFIKENCSSIIKDADFIKQICKRRTGIGSDCVIILSKVSNYDFKMDYYNSDGTWETFCANGARCAVKYLYQKKMISSKTQFLAGDGKHEAKVEKNKIFLKIKSPQIISKKLKIENYEGYLVDSGAKHFCIWVNNLEEIENIESICKNIRYSKEFMPKGVNVNFFEIINTDLIQVYTYEKGVEKMMLSCGSGSVASSFICSKLITIKDQIKAINPGGELIISFNKEWSNVWLKGESEILFESELNINQYK